MDIVRRLTTAGALALALAAGGTLAAAGAAHAQTPVTLQYWVYSDFAQGDALKLQQQFIAEFEAAHPGVKIVISGKGDDDLTTGQVDGCRERQPAGRVHERPRPPAPSSSRPARSTTSTPTGWRCRRNTATSSTRTPSRAAARSPQVMYCLPYTGFGEIMFRNLTVLKEAGIDTATPPKRLGGMVRPDEEGQGGRQIRDAGPDAGLQFRRQHLRHRRAGQAEWGIDFATKKTLIKPETMTRRPCSSSST